MPHRREKIERKLSPAFPHYRGHKQQGQQQCLWLVPTEAAPPLQPSITSLSLAYIKKPAGMTCTVTGEATHSRQHMDGRKIQLSASRLLIQRHWWILGAQNPTQNPEKGKSKLKSFIPVCFIQLSSSYMVQKEVIMSPYRFFLLHNEGIFFFFAGKCMLLLNAFTYKPMCLCLICLDSV